MGRSSRPRRDRAVHRPASRRFSQSGGGRSRFGAVLYRTTELLQKPDVSGFDPSPAEESRLRERLLNAGEARAQA